MVKNLITATETERMARAITKSYSKATLAVAVRGLGLQVTAEDDIFRSLVVSRIAPDFDAAVRLLAHHLDSGSYIPGNTEELVDGRIERRKNPR